MMVYVWSKIIWYCNRKHQKNFNAIHTVKMLKLILFDIPTIFKGFQKCCTQ